MEELTINGIGGWRKRGVAMGEGFVAELASPPVFKEMPTNRSRLEDGERIVPGIAPKLDSRQLTLEFVVFGNSPEQADSRRRTLWQELCRRPATICVPARSKEVFKLHLQGKGGECQCDTAGCVWRLVLKFLEPNPADRG